MPPESGRAPSPSSPPARRVFWLGCLLVAAVFAVYARSLNAPFVFDDRGAVLENATIRRLDSLQVLRPPADGSTTTGRPVVNVSFAVNYALTGERVWSYHATNVLIHAAAALLLFGIIRRTAVRAYPAAEGASRSAERQVMPFAFLVALLWALHPLQTETVICIAQRTESLAALFYLLTLYAFVRAAEGTPGRSRRWHGVSVVACLAGMATKEIMVTAPCFVLLFDRTFWSGSFAAAWRQRRSYYVALFATWLLLAALVAGGGGARGVAAGFGHGVSSWQYLLQQAEALVVYLKLAVWPHPLVLDYGNAVPSSLAEVLLPGLIVVGLLAASLWALVRRPVWGFFGVGFFLLLSPSSSVVPLVTQTIAEHRMYLPLALVVAAIAVAAFRQVRLAPWLLAGVAAVFAGVTIARNADYRDPITLWRDNVTKYPSAARGHNNLAHALQQDGQAAAANAEFARAVALDPGYVTAHYDWGVALLEQNRPDDAIRELKAAVALAPAHADARLNLGNALMRRDRVAEAIEHYQAAIELHPAADAYFNLGVALVQSDRLDEGERALRTAMTMTAPTAAMHYFLGVVAERRGKQPEALAEWREALRLDPRNVLAHGKLGLALAQAGDLPQAEAHFRALTEISPHDAEAFANLGNVLLLRGNARAALESYRRALQLRPDDPRLRENLELAKEALRP